MVLTKVLHTYPQPIAYAYGCILRSSSKSEPEQLDRILRCAEVTARYLTAMAIATFAARCDDTNIAPPEALIKFNGNLSFGHFVSVIQAVAGLKTSHPLQSQFSASFLKKTSSAKGKLEILNKLRNDIGHEIKGLNEDTARQIFINQQPLKTLEELLEGIEPLCVLPLFLVDTQQPIRKITHIWRLLLMGESKDPIPQQVSVSEPFMDDKRLYIGTSEGVLPLHPTLVWDLEENRSARGIYIIHQILKDRLEYSSQIAENQPITPPVPDDILSLTQGKIVEIETIKLQDGRSFADEWQERRNSYSSSQINITQPVDWSSLDKATLKRYIDILKMKLQRDDDDLEIDGIKLDWNKHEEVIRLVFFDGRGELTADERRQVLLLFGQKQQIRQAIGRDTLDLRVRKDPEQRWDKRDEFSGNLIEAIFRAITFISTHHPLFGDLSGESLQVPTGSTDYIAVREALVNLIIHQDYNDPRTVAQIELEPDRTKMVNAGSSLVSEQERIDGGTSTARNPIVARALKLIGFAELAGSGLREVSRVWRDAQRRPPTIRSEEQNNRFSIELDSRLLEIVIDAFWQKRLGAKVSPEEAKLLSLLSGFPQGMTLAQMCAGTGQRSEDALSRCQRLLHQALLDVDGEKYRLKEHLLELAKEAEG
jgi:predicted HTH transcriptional regulator